MVCVKIRCYASFDAHTDDCYEVVEYSDVSSALLCSALLCIKRRTETLCTGRGKNITAGRTRTQKPLVTHPICFRYPALPSAARIRMLQRRLKSIKQLASAPTEEAGGGGGGREILREDVGDTPSPAAVMDASI
jgi:hypothetical protein